LKESLINKIKWHIGNKFNLKYFSIYRSFGVKEIFKPIIGWQTAVRKLCVGFNTTSELELVRALPLWFGFGEL
jgi:hypothetical protein